MLLMQITHIQIICKDFEIKHLGEYQDLYVKSDTLLLADLFDNFQNMCLEIYQLDFARFLTALGLAWQAALRKTKVKLNLLTDIDMSLIAKIRYQRRNMSPCLLICKS